MASGYETRLISWASSNMYRVLVQRTPSAKDEPFPFESSSTLRSYMILSRGLSLWPQSMLESKTQKVTMTEDFEGSDRRNESPSAFSIRSSGFGGPKGSAAR